MNSFLVLASMALALIAAAPARAVSEGTVTVFAAASLSDTLQEIAAAYEKTNSVQIRFNFAGSAILARQIEAGAPADIFFSADQARMQSLQDKGYVKNGARCDLLGNSLAIVVTANTTETVQSMRDLTRGHIRRVAIGNPRTVPAGTYAQDYLEKAGLWDAIKPKLVLTENVRAALAAVASGNVDAGIVYRTDALITKAVRVAVQIPPEKGPRIVYPVAMLTNADSESSRLFFEYLCSAGAARIFQEHGFTVLNPKLSP